MWNSLYLISENVSFSLGVCDAVVRKFFLWHMYMIEVWPLATSLCNKSGCINYTGNGGLNYGFFGCILVQFPPWRVCFCRCSLFQQFGQMNVVLVWNTQVLCPRPNKGIIKSKHGPCIHSCKKDQWAYFFPGWWSILWNFY